MLGRMANRFGLIGSASAEVGIRVVEYAEPAQAITE